MLDNAQYTYWESHFVELVSKSSKGNKTVPGKVATARTEDGQKQNTETGTKIQTEGTKEHRTTGEEMKGPTIS
jgi:hypothetical protein